MAKEANDPDLKPEDIKIEDEGNDQPAPEGYTADEWSDLSETEKAGILESIAAPEGEEEPEPELTEEEKAKLEAIAGDDDTPPEKKPDEKKPDEKAAEAEIGDEELLTFKAVVADSELPAQSDVEEVIPPEIQTKLDGLDKKYDDGDITLKEYNVERDKLNRQIVKHNYEVADQAKAKNIEAKEALIWKKEQVHFLDAKPEYVANKTEDAAEKERRNDLFDALAAKVRRLSADPKNSHLTGMQVLLMADKAVKAAFGIKKEAAPPAPDAKDKKPPARVPDVKTLADVPRAQANDGVDDSFAQIDKLRGEAYENALEKMSQQARDAYLARADR